MEGVAAYAAVVVVFALVAFAKRRPVAGSLGLVGALLPLVVLAVVSAPFAVGFSIAGIVGALRRPRSPLPPPGEPPPALRPHEAHPEDFAQRAASPLPAVSAADQGARSGVNMLTVLLLCSGALVFLGSFLPGTEAIGEWTFPAGVLMLVMAVIRYTKPSAPVMIPFMIAVAVATGAASFVIAEYVRWISIRAYGLWMVLVGALVGIVAASKWVAGSSVHSPSSAEGGSLEGGAE